MVIERLRAVHLELLQQLKQGGCPLHVARLPAGRQQGTQDGRGQRGGQRGRLRGFCRGGLPHGQIQQVQGHSDVAQVEGVPNELPRQTAYICNTWHVKSNTVKKLTGYYYYWLKLVLSGSVGRTRLGVECRWSTDREDKTEADPQQSLINQNGHI